MTFLYTYIHVYSYTHRDYPPWLGQTICNIPNTRYTTAVFKHLTTL